VQERSYVHFVFPLTGRKYNPTAWGDTSWRRSHFACKPAQLRVAERFPRIWSPPVLQGPVGGVTGTGLLPYIRPVNEEALLFWPR